MSRDEGPHLFEPLETLAARTLGLEAATSEIPDDIAPAIEALKGGTDALYVAGDPLLNANMVRLNILAARARRFTFSGRWSRQADVL